MKQLELTKVLKHIKAVEVGSWNRVLAIVKMIQSGARVLEKEHADDFKRSHPESYPLDLSEIDTWSTYDGCVSIMLQFNKANKLIANIHLYNGDIMNGSKTSLRFTAKIELPNYFLNCKSVKEQLTRALNIHAELAYKEYLKDVQEKWENEFKKRILS